VTSPGRRRGEGPEGRPLRAALLVLTFTTGLVDAVSYLGLGQVFTGFVTGNVVLLGFGLVGTEGFSVAAPSISLGAFLAGALVGGRLAAHLGGRHLTWIAVSLLVEAALVGGAAAVTVGLDPDRLVDRRFGAIALLGAAMGVRNATIRVLAVPDLTTTVLTLTITGLTADSRLAGTRTVRPARRLAAIVAMLLGAVAGALLLRVSLVLPLVIMAGLVAATSLGYVAASLLQARANVSPGETGAAGCE
jgi:uncharacterized membrane protein YoaK (UPF0700 family)